MLSGPPLLSHLETLIFSNLNGRRQISLFYRALLSFSKELTIDRLEAWKLDVQEDIHKAEWEMACLNAQKQSINTRMKCCSTSG